jgi:hypothetical protein
MFGEYLSDWADHCMRRIPGVVAAFFMFVSASGPSAAQAEKLQPSDQKMIVEKLLSEAVRAGHLPPSSVPAIRTRIQPLLNLRELLPDAIAIGFMGRCQAGIGVCLADQINVGIVGKKIHLSHLQVLGGEFGEQVAANIEVYLAVCYGECNDEEAAGWFVGVDSTATLGAGINGFMDYGVDWSEITSDKSFEEILDSSVFYAGVGLTTGAGAGVSLGIHPHRNP